VKLAVSDYIHLKKIGEILLTELNLKNIARHADLIKILKK
jgi:uncharacterized ubiquitin-like protein YukD